jgi:hypothetical protein
MEILQRSLLKELNESKAVDGSKGFRLSHLLLILDKK